MLFIPAYNCAPQVVRVLAQLDPSLQRAFAEVCVIDNGSSDGTAQIAAERAAELPGTRVYVLQNDGNYGLGGSHKVAMQRCLERGYDGLVVLHGDDQGRLQDLMTALAGRRDGVECLLGARFMRGSRLRGYSPVRIAANVAFNVIYSGLARRALWDLGAGLNYYSRAFLERRLWEACADDLTFNYHLLLRTASTDAHFEFVPISWREDDQVSNASLAPHGLTMLRIARDRLMRGGWWLSAEHGDNSRARTYTVLYP
jgi:glycosyltransferase involved in cell wall biosynthesis